METLAELRTDRMTPHEGARVLNTAVPLEAAAHSVRLIAFCIAGDHLGSLFALPLCAWQAWRHFAPPGRAAGAYFGGGLLFDVTEILKRPELERRAWQAKVETGAYAALMFYATLGLAELLVAWALAETEAGRWLHGALKLHGAHTVVRGEIVLDD